jgi:Tfp pilus assembly protein PilF
LGIRIETAAGDAAAVTAYKERLAREFPQSAAAREAREPVAVNQPKTPEKG